MKIDRISVGIDHKCTNERSIAMPDDDLGEDAYVDFGFSDGKVEIEDRQCNNCGAYLIDESVLAYLGTLFNSTVQIAKGLTVTCLPLDDDEQPMEVLVPDNAEVVRMFVANYGGKAEAVPDVKPIRLLDDE